MMIENELENSIARALYAVSGIGSKSLKRLYAETGSVEGILQLTEQRITELIKKEELTPILNEYRSDKKALFERMRKYRKTQEEKGIHFVSIGEEAYPKRLRELIDAPFGIYYMGSLPEEDTPTVSIIGARECSEYGKKAAELFGKTLAGYGVSIISGMARGIDGISQSAALSVGGKSYGILGCGVDVVYPKENLKLYEALKKNGGVISEFLPGQEPKGNFFPMRNRIISGLADVLLVVEARQKSGTYITVCQALEQGKEIFAVPGRITDGLSDGCNRLIAQGAGIASDPMMILDALNIRADRIPSGEMAEQGNKEKSSKSGILRVLEDTPKSIEDIQESLKNLGIDISNTDLLCELTNLCIEQLVEGIGNYYRKIG
ncbi:MAG: DNA-processing protein DprA [Lachnospiraceae bacterium]|nr:DNA-processing protein DprA [Lachnospiraceae bacterium]